MSISPLPTPPNRSMTSDAFVAAADAFLAALPAFATQANDLAAQMNAGGSDTLGWRNMLLNGSFRLNQRGLSSLTDGSYGPDRWYALTQTGAIGCSILTAPEEDGAGHTQATAVRLTQSQASAQRFGMAQIIESAECTRFRSQKTTFGARVRCSAAATIRYAIVDWKGTADTVTRDIVNDWTSASFIEGGFFITNASPQVVGAVAVAANTWTDLPGVTGVHSSSTNNIAVLVWTDAAQAQNVTLDIGEAQHERGAVRTPFETRHYGLELSLCQRFYEKSFQDGTAPAQNAGTPGVTTFSQAVAASTTQGGMFCPFKVTKRAAPTVTLYNPLAANAQVRNNSRSTDWTSSTTVPSVSGIQVGSTSPVGSAAGDTASVHWSAEAEL